MKKLLLKNALIFRDCGFEKTDILIVDGKIAEVRTSLKDEEAEVIDMAGLSILPGFIGKMYQVPPKFSAKSVNGKRAYEMPRNNIEFELKPKEILQKL